MEYFCSNKRKNSTIGAGESHESAIAHANGTAIYTDDIPLPKDTLHVAIGQSTIASGVISGLNLAEVKKYPGVTAVLTANDIPGANDVSPLKGDDPLLAKKRIDYWGQPIFAVVATNRRIARNACDLAIIEYDEKTPIITIEEAVLNKSFLEPPQSIERGNPDIELESSRNKLSGTIIIGGQEHLYLEGQAAVAIPQEGKSILIYSSTQHPTEIQHKVALTLGIAYTDVTVEVCRIGGGFGGKESQGNLPACLAALTASKTNRPSKVIYDRDDDIRITGKRHDFKIEYSVGFDEKGKINAIVFNHLMRCGMSWDLSEPIGDRAMLHADNCYQIPNIRITSTRCRTNTASNTAFRGFGGPQGMLGIERVIDEIAHFLNTDPIQIRRLNFYSDLNENNISPYGQNINDCVIESLFNELAITSRYVARRKKIVEHNKSDPIIRRGLSITPVKFGISFTKSFLNQAGSSVNIYTDGSISVCHAGVEMGQGLYTKIKQIVASVFGLKAEQIKIQSTSTEKIPNTSATAASSSTDLNGMAAFNAAQSLKNNLSMFLASRVNVEPSTITYSDGKVFFGTNDMGFAELAKEAWLSRIPLFANGFHATPEVSWNKKNTVANNPFYYFSYGAAVTEVAIDTLTGENKILQTDILHDVGNSINPSIDRGQIEGGFVQGAGWLTTEELVWSASGELKTHSPSTYKIPTFRDQPIKFNVNFFDSGGNSKPTIYRSKAIGEPPLMLAISVLMAISDAMRGFNQAKKYPALDSPATPEKILLSLKKMNFKAHDKNSTPMSMV